MKYKIILAVLLGGLFAFFAVKVPLIREAKRPLSTNNTKVSELHNSELHLNEEATRSHVETKYEQAEHTVSKNGNLELNEVLKSIPAIDDWEKRKNISDVYDGILRDRDLTTQIYETFDNLQGLIKSYGDSQAEVRVKMIDFFRYSAKDNMDLLAKTISNIPSDPTFSKNIKGRQADYKDLVEIYLKNISAEEMKLSLDLILKQISYQPNFQPLVATAISRAHPKLMQDEEFLQKGLKTLRGEL